MSKERLYQNAYLIDGKHILRSLDRHDYVEYDGLALDGGTEYIRTTGEWGDRGVSLCIHHGDTVEQAAEKITMRPVLDNNRWVLVKNVSTNTLQDFYKKVNVSPPVRSVVIALLHYTLTKRGVKLEEPVVEYDNNTTLSEIMEKYPIPEDFIKRQKMLRDIAIQKALENIEKREEGID